MFCQNCGANNSNDRNNCEKCGRSLGDTDKTASIYNSLHTEDEKSIDRTASVFEHANMDESENSINRTEIIERTEISDRENNVASFMSAEDETEISADAIRSADDKTSGSQKSKKKMRIIIIAAVLLALSVLSASAASLAKFRATSLAQPETAKIGVPDIAGKNSKEAKVSVPDVVGKNSEEDKNLKAAVSGEETVVPAVVGLSSSEAISRLEQIGLNVNLDKQFNDTVAKELVVSQSVAAGQKKNKGAYIDLLVSKGKEFEIVPNLLGKTATEASNELQKLGFSFASKQQVDDNHTPGLVIGQSIGGGEKANVGEKIEVTICVGSAKIEMPNVVGKTTAQAMSALANIGLGANESEQYNDNVSAGSVISQGTAPGTAVSKGSSVNIVVSKGASTWSGWVDALPAGVDSSAYYIEQKTQYQYRDKEFTTNSANSLAGWTLYNTTSDWGAWSGWSTAAVNASDTRQVNTQQVANPQQYSTVYRYNRWRYYNAGDYWYSYASGWGSLPGIWQYAELGYQLSPKKVYDGHQAYGSYGSEAADTWFNYSTASIAQPLTYHTEYQYRDMVYTYYLYRFKAWSAWQDSAVSATADRQVNTKKVYRYRVKQ